MDYLVNILTNEDSILQESMVQMRRHLHSIPELSMEEIETSKYIEKVLREAGFVEIYTGLAGTGTVAVLRGVEDQSILLRADIDALPLTELTQVPFKSTTDGKMHACGHDAHVAMLLCTAVEMQRQVSGGLRLRRGIKFCFQPGEENADGAKLMLNDTSKYDILEASPIVTNCFGMHISSQVLPGTICYDIGFFSAYSERWEMRVRGRGGHAMSPEYTIDALQVGTQIVTAIYQIRGRNVNQNNASSISIGKFHCGSVPNVINEYAHIMGSIRTTNPDDREAINKRLTSICQGAAIQHDCEVEFTLINGYKAVINDPTLEPAILRVIDRSGSKLLRGTLELAGEDFYNFSGIFMKFHSKKDRRPSAYVILGAAHKESIVKGKPTIVHHSPTFDLDESAFIDGFRYWISIINEYQN